MIPAKFDYVRAASVEEALAALAEHGEDAKLLAGGHSLLPLMKLRLAAPSVLVDIGRLDELSYVRDAGDHLAIGALTRHADVLRDPLVQRHCAALASASSCVIPPYFMALPASLLRWRISSGSSLFRLTTTPFFAITAAL